MKKVLCSFNTHQIRCIPLTYAILFVTFLHQGDIRASQPSINSIDTEYILRIDSLMTDAMEKEACPGGVILIGNRERIIWKKAYGYRVIKPEKIKMTADTIFDLASLTKVVATATSVAILIERGQLSLSDRVSRFIPEFAAKGKERITIEQLLIHRGGLVPDNSLQDYAQGPPEAMRKIYNLDLVAHPGEKFIYTDVGYIVLGEVVKQVTGLSLNRFARQELFLPAGMSRTTFNPPKIWWDKCAPQEKRDKKWIIGQVHDPRAFALGGVAGHAGLFSTADDLARYCRMILNGGEIDGRRILSPLTVRTMTEPRPLGAVSGVRGLGFDIATGYSSARGDLFCRYRSFGHTGFTGTSMWIDPTAGIYVIILTNRLHPDGKGNVIDLRRKVATVVASAVTKADPFDRITGYPWIDSDRVTKPYRDTSLQDSQVLTGLDVLVRDGCKILTGRKVGVITNHTGLTRDGKHIVNLIANAKNVDLVALFSPEHGFKGVLDRKIKDDTDPLTGLPIYSLYGKTRIPTDKMLAGIDTLVFDIQDIGTRFYTYISTMGNAMQAATKHNIRFIVVDRPNPITGRYVEGPLADADKFGFTAFYRLPVAHGMTIGELAQLFNKEMKIGADLVIIKMENWYRHQWYDQTGLFWINPSPNMRNLTEAILYPGVGLIESSNISVGRGTDEPFERFGAPWIDARKLAAALNDSGLKGVRFVPIEFTPASSKHAGKKCGGVHIMVTDRESINPVLVGITIAWQLNRLLKDDFQLERVNNLLKNDRILAALGQAKTPVSVMQMWQKDLEKFQQLRKKYLLYR
ncbi:MAG: exo-beta-N-acetylmuramidase NamZ domain-containing protein [Planctomycetota bacterium]